MQYITIKNMRFKGMHVLKKLSSKNQSVRKMLLMEKKEKKSQIFSRCVLVEANSAPLSSVSTEQL